jgi:hypothetical protein
VAKTPPIPPASRSPKGPGKPQARSAQKGKNAGRETASGKTIEDDPSQQGDRANVQQNTTHQGNRRTSRPA